MQYLKFVEWPKVRDVQNPKWGTILNDIDSHMPAGHIYADADMVTHAHETTHGINANIRNKFQVGMKIPGGFYCLENRAIVIEGPNGITLSDVADNVPVQLRGSIYNLYLVEQRRHWNTVPLYVLDEFVAYSNGSAAGLDLAKKNLWVGDRRSDTISHMLEFLVYSTVLAKTIKEKASLYDDAIFKGFFVWSIDRSLRLFKKSKQFELFRDDKCDAYLDTFKRNHELIDFLQDYARTRLENYGTSEFL